MDAFVMALGHSSIGRRLLCTTEISIHMVNIQSMYQPLPFQVVFSAPGCAADNKRNYFASLTAEIRNQKFLEEIWLIRSANLFLSGIAKNQ